MNNLPLVSIPILTYNGEKFLKAQLDSIFSQTYTNIEVIAFDDRSTDGTVNILEQYKQSHGLSYYINETNLGLSKNFLQALEKCKGDYIAPSDHDDIWIENKIEHLVANIHDNVLIYSDSIPIDETGNLFEAYNKHKDFKFISGHNNKAFFFFNCISAHNMMFKKELIPFIEPLPIAKIYYDWWVAFIASSYGNIVYFPEPLVYYRRHNAQVTNMSKNKEINPVKRLIQKDSLKKESLNNQLVILNSFAGLKVIDAETKESLKIIIQHLSSLLNGYFDKKLYEYLLTIKNEVFALKDEKRYKKIAKSIAKGIWYFRLRLYS